MADVIQCILESSPAWRPQPKNDIVSKQSTRKFENIILSKEVNNAKTPNPKTCFLFICFKKLQSNRFPLSLKYQKHFIATILTPHQLFQRQELPLKEPKMNLSAASQAGPWPLKIEFPASKIHRTEPKEEKVTEPLPPHKCRLPDSTLFLKSTLSNKKLSRQPCKSNSPAS